MYDRILDQLGMTLNQVGDLPGNLRSRLLNFLLRWKHTDTLHACLDVLIPANPSLVSLLDLRARALLSQGRPEQATAVMEERLRIKTSLTAQSLLARAQLAQGNADTALDIAETLAKEQADSSLAWNLLGTIEVTRENPDAALEAFRHLAELRPHSKGHLLGMLALYQMQKDWVTASGYAVQVLNATDDGRPLPVGYLHHLRDYFRASGEVTRAIEVAAELERRYANEIAELKAVLPGNVSPQPRIEATPRPAQAESDLPHPIQAAPPPPSFDQVPVSAQERSRIQQAAQQLFCFDTLLPGQLQILACTLRGEDVLAILPTGGGKSLCYQLPAMLDERGTTLVVSPLIALMKDQVDSLPEALRRRATTINSTLDGYEMNQRLDQVSQGHYRLVYAAPERLRQPPFLHALRRAGINRLVIDEAHCVSVWGHDFRPDYLTIAQAREHMGKPPLLALTATAPPRVRQDILRQLGDMRIIAGDVTRPNLRLEVLNAQNADAKRRHLVSFCQSEPGSGIVYADTRARCEDLAALLCRYGVDASHYHAGIDDRAGTQDRFMSGQTRVIVATIAFGMGIDKPDIRFIVHYAPPKSVEAYYQEAGRAGRDGQPSRCLLMYAPSDRGTLTRRAHSSQLTVDFLRQVYGSVRHRLTTNPAKIAIEDLERDLRVDDTRIRVALSLLEEASLLRRGPDLPRAATVRLKTQGTPGEDPHWQRFLQAARLRPAQSLTLDLAAVAREAELPPEDIERHALEWCDASWLDYRPSGRDLLLELLPQPPDSSERIGELLERHEVIQNQRIDEIAAYARTGLCRHGHLNAYLGGRSIERCDACDNCVASPPLPQADLPDEQGQLLAVLNGIAHSRRGWGRVTLTCILHGDEKRRGGSRLPDSAKAQPEFGVLAFRSRSAIKKMVEHLEHSDLLKARVLDNGGAVLELTPQGRQALNEPNRLAAQASPRPAPQSKQSPPSDEPAPDIDEALYQKLCAWRREQAQAHKVASFVIFHNAHLRTISAHQPTSLEALSKLKGMGTKKLEKYGADIVALVGRHLKDSEHGRQPTDK